MKLKIVLTGLLLSFAQVSAPAVFAKQETAPPTGRPAHFSALEGVKVGKIVQFDSETKPDKLVERMLRGQGFNENDGPADNPPRYFYNKIDLNGDGIPEYLAYYVSENYCGTGGCRFLIGQVRGKGLRIIERIIITHMPVIILDHKTRGWHDFVLCAAGGGLIRHYCLYKWKGNKYDDDGIAMKAGEILNGRAYIANDFGSAKGIKFK